MKNKRLGKGLEALIPHINSEDEVTHMENLAEIEVSKVHVNPYQPRMEFDPKGIEELKQSILENGIIQPITVRRIDSGFELIAGERRIRAVKELGFSKIPAFMIEVESEDQMLEFALVENIQREDLNPIDLAKAMQRLQKEYGLTQEAVSKKVGKDRATVANFIRLLKLPGIIQESLRKEEITIGHAKAFMGLSSPSEQIKLWRKTVKQGWNVRKVEAYVKNASSGSDVKKSGIRERKSPYLIELEDKLRTLLGTRVILRFFEGGKGKIEISFFSDQELERIIDLIHRSEG